MRQKTGWEGYVCGVFFCLVCSLRDAFGCLCRGVLHFFVLDYVVMILDLCALIFFPWIRGSLCGRFSSVAVLLSGPWACLCSAWSWLFMWLWSFPWFSCSFLSLCSVYV